MPGLARGGHRARLQQRQLRAGAGTVSEPGSYPISIGVGAVDINRNIAGFSSRGPAPNLPPWNDPNNWERSDWNRVKPEVVAPGVNVRSSVPGNTYANFNGTSMASPHVTGLAGILRQIRPDLTVNEFYNIIIDTAYFTPTWGTARTTTTAGARSTTMRPPSMCATQARSRAIITDGSCDTRCTGRGSAGVRQHAGQPGAGRGHPQAVLRQLRQSTARSWRRAPTPSQ